MISKFLVLNHYCNEMLKFCSIEQGDKVLKYCNTLVALNSNGMRKDIISGASDASRYIALHFYKYCKYFCFQ